MTSTSVHWISPNARMYHILSVTHATPYRPVCLPLPLPAPLDHTARLSFCDSLNISFLSNLNVGSSNQRLQRERLGAQVRTVLQTMVSKHPPSQPLLSRPQEDPRNSRRNSETCWRRCGPIRVPRGNSETAFFFVFFRRRFFGTLYVQHGRRG